MAEKLTTLGYAFMLEGVLCLLVAIASIFVKTIPKPLCVASGIISGLFLLSASVKSGANELQWLDSTLDLRVAVHLVHYLVAIIICMLNCHAHRTMKPKELAAFFGVIAALFMISPLVLAWRISASHT